MIDLALTSCVSALQYNEVLGKGAFKTVYVLKSSSSSICLVNVNVNV